MGPDGMLLALAAGANDVGGTLMNESITRAAGAGFGQEMPPERLESIIRAAGRTPRLRTTRYADCGGGTPRRRVRRSRAGGAGVPPREAFRTRLVGAAGAFRGRVRLIFAAFGDRKVARVRVDDNAQS